MRKRGKAKIIGSENAEVIMIDIGKGAVAAIDAQDLNLVKDYPWSLRIGTRGHKYAYCQMYEAGRRSNFFMHRVIMGVEDSLVFVDHADGDGLNNRRANLRIATKAENGRNRRMNSHSRNRFKGVAKVKNSYKYTARIYVCGRCHYLGIHNTDIDAATAYNEAAIKLHGEFASLNILT